MVFCSDAQGTTIVSNAPGKETAILFLKGTRKNADSTNHASNFDPCLWEKVYY